MKKQMWCIYSEWLRWFFFALVWKRSCESLLSLEGTRVGRSGSRSVTPHTGILIRREPWGETVHLAESTLSIWSPGRYPESSQKTASVLTTTQQADWKSLKANTSIFVLSVSLEVDSSFSLSLQSFGSLTSCLDQSFFFPPVSVHSLNINICRTDVAMDASCSSQFCSEGFLRESCTSAADRWKPCLLFVRFFSLSLLIAFYKPFADRMAPFKLFELRGRTLVQSASSSEALCVFVLPLIGHAYPKGSLTSCHILDLCLKIAVSRCLSTGAVPGQTLHTAATPRD